MPAATAEATMVRETVPRTIRVDIGPIVPGGEPVTVVADVHWPDRLADHSLLLFCVPGGGVTRGYFDLTGDDTDSFSFVRPMLNAGHVVVAIDPPGVGESTRPADGFALTGAVLAEAHRRVLHQVREHLMAGTYGRRFVPCATIGVGHSAGAMIQVMQQAATRDYDAMLLFCFGNGGLIEQLDDEQRAALSEPDHGRARFAAFARRRFGGRGYIPVPTRDDDSVVARAMRRVHDMMIAVIGVHAMTPGNVEGELAALDVPVFVAVGDRDMTGPAADLGAAYRACPDLTVYVVETSGHHVFVAPTAPALYRRVVGWLDIIAKGKQ